MGAEETSTGTSRGDAPEDGAVLVVDVGPEGWRTVLVVRGELDVATAPVFCQRLVEVLGDGRRGDLVVDLAGAGFVGVAGIEVLAQAARHLRDDGEDLVLRGVSPLTRRILEIGRLTSLFVIDDGS